MHASTQTRKHASTQATGQARTQGSMQATGQLRKHTPTHPRTHAPTHITYHIKLLRVISMLTQLRAAEAHDLFTIGAVVVAKITGVLFFIVAVAIAQPLAGMCLCSCACTSLDVECNRARIHSIVTNCCVYHVHAATHATSYEHPSSHTTCKHANHHVQSYNK